MIGLITPTCKCRFRKSRRLCPTTTRPAAIAPRFPCRMIGKVVASCSILAAPNPCSPFGSTGRPLALPKTRGCRANFDITSFVKTGEINTLACVCIKWSDASFIEDQDQWWLGGIYRDVFVYSTEETFIRDVFAVGHMDGQLKVTAKIGFSFDRERDWKLKGELFDSSGQSVL